MSFRHCWWRPSPERWPDRFDRRWVIAGCDLMAAVLVVLLAAVVVSGSLVVEHLFVFNALTAIVGVIRDPYYRAAMSVIVPVDRLTQANGFIGFTERLVQVDAP